LPFGGISVLAVGDFAQLPPVLDRPLYSPVDGMKDLHLQGKQTFLSQFKIVSELTTNMRQQGEEPEQVRFKQILENIRDGKIIEDDWHVLMTRRLSILPPDERNLFLDNPECLFLRATTEKAEQGNTAKLNKLPFPCFSVLAKHTGDPKVKTLNADKFEGLRQVAELAKGAKVMLTRNLWTEAGLVNGASGVVVDVVFADHNDPLLAPSRSQHPDYVLVDFPKYSGPPFIQELPTVLPIVPMTAFTRNGASGTRTQFPLMLAWEMTVHKAQGLTVDRCCVDIGETVFAAHLEYVALSRCKQFKGIALVDFTFDRYSKIPTHKHFKERKEEEKRLQLLDKFNQ
jgi:ATP-dependent DNA helicase PIF1